MTPKSLEKSNINDPDIAFSQKNDKKAGMLKRFCQWVAMGTDKAKKNKQFCPT